MAPQHLNPQSSEPPGLRTKFGDMAVRGRRFGAVAAQRPGVQSEYPAKAARLLARAPSAAPPPLAGASASMAGPRAAVIFDADVPGFNAWAAPASRLPASTTSALTFVWSAAAGCYVVQLSELGRTLHGAPANWDLHMTAGLSCSWRQSAAVTAALLHAALEPAARSGPPRRVFPFAAVAFLVAQPGTERAPLGALWRRRFASNAGVLAAAKAGLLDSSRERLTALLVRARRRRVRAHLGAAQHAARVGGGARAAREGGDERRGRRSSSRGRGGGHRRARQAKTGAGRRAARPAGGAGVRWGWLLACVLAPNGQGSEPQGSGTP